MPVQGTNPYHPSLSQAALHSASLAISTTVSQPRGPIPAGRVTVTFPSGWKGHQ